jgi:hypothetical protein
MVEEQVNDSPSFEENLKESDSNDGEGNLSLDSFVFYSSPRYYRLIFSNLKPATKSGDLVSALGEMKREKFITFDSDWEKIKLTKKGNQYRKLIKQLLDIEALHTPQSNGIFDYRSEQGRKVIVELLRFIAAKLNFYEYSQYLNLPILEPEKKTKEFMSNFGEGNEKPLDFTSEEGRTALENFLKKFRKKNKDTAEHINKTIFSQTEPINFNIGLIKRFLKNAGLNRPEPLFNHFNLVMPKLFEVHERQFSVYLPELQKLLKILEENLEDFHKDENKWLSDYFNLLGLPTNFFGFAVSDFSYASKETDAFLNLAMLGPKIFASQFSSLIKELGDLSLIIFPITPKESIVISGAMWDMLYYFMIPTDQCIMKIDTQLACGTNFPDLFLSSVWRFSFGKAVDRVRTFDDIQKDMEKEVPARDMPKDQRKLLEEEHKLKETQQSEQFKSMARYASPFYAVCEMIARKFNAAFSIPRCTCVFENGMISFTRLFDYATIVNTITLGKVQFGAEFQKLLKKINDSMSEILDINGDEN